jgi:hypothetical protein
MRISGALDAALDDVAAGFAGADSAAIRVPHFSQNLRPADCYCQTWQTSIRPSRRISQNKASAEGYTSSALATAAG